MMRAMGMTDSGVIAVYVLEAGFLGLAGSILGIIVGCLINLPMVEYGLDLSSMIGAMGGSWGFRITGVMRSTWSAGLIAGTGITATALSALVSILPIRRALRMEITQSLRFE
jgi:lipoprotein-releasing system permease protein